MATSLIELFANNAKTTLAGAITNTATSAALATGTGVLFPNPASGQFFAMTLNDAATGLLYEVVYVTAVTGDTVTMVRGQEGTEALPWSAGDFAYNAATAGSLAGFVQDAQLLSLGGGYSVDTGSANALVLALTPTPASYAALKGALIRASKSAASNTGAVTVNINGLGAIPLTHADGSALGSGELPASGVLTFSIAATGTSAMLQSLGIPPGGSGGTGTVTAVNTGTGLTGGPISTTGTVALAAIAAGNVMANLGSGSAAPSPIPTTSLFTALGCGYLGLPQFVRNANYTFGLVDSAIESFFETTATATIPANASVAFPIGTVLVATADVGDVITLACGDTLRNPIGNLTGTRTITGPGSAVVCKKKTTEWWIVGGYNIS